MSDSTKLEMALGQRDALVTAMTEACNLLAERTHGNPARSAGHNARLCLESALHALQPQGDK